MIYWRRPYVIVIIFQHIDFASMCLAVLTHIPQDVSSIRYRLHLEKCGESFKKVFSNFYVLGCANCYEVMSGLS